MSGPHQVLTVNGRTVPVEDVPDDELLLDTLRWRFGLRGTKEGCRSGGCGACTVLVDGRGRLSCLTLTHQVEGATVTTIEGAADDPVGRLVQEAFVSEVAFQCGYCTPGFVMAVTGLLKERRATGSTAEIVAGLGGNLCRCTGYTAIVRAVELARRRLG